MQRLNREPFSPDAQFVCLKPFVMGGVAYVAGSVVDTAEVELRRLRQMYEARIIDPAPRAQKAALLKPPVRQQEALAPSRRIEHRGFGRWYVLDESGNEVSGPLSKEEAEAAA